MSMWNGFAKNCKVKKFLFQLLCYWHLVSRKLFFCFLFFSDYVVSIGTFLILFFCTNIVHHDGARQFCGHELKMTHVQSVVSLKRMYGVLSLEENGKCQMSVKIKFFSDFIVLPQWISRNQRVPVNVFCDCFLRVFVVVVVVVLYFTRKLCTLVCIIYYKRINFWHTLTCMWD